MVQKSEDKKFYINDLSNSKFVKDIEMLIESGLFDALIKRIIDVGGINIHYSIINTGTISGSSINGNNNNLVGCGIEGNENNINNG